MRQVNWLILILACSVLVSCAGRPTPYQKDTGPEGGYSDIRLRENIYEVKFRGNLDTDFETQKKYVYRRSQELCAEKSFSDFNVIQAPPDFETATVKTVIGCIQ